jgi:large subunit ribosomal protein L7/L12
MAKLTKESFIESLKEMTLVEINELVEGMKEEFGIDPSAVAVAAAPAAGAGDAGAAESANVNVVIADGGAAKVQVIKVVKDITGLGLKEAKDIVDANGVVKENVARSEAEEIKAKLEEAGATVEFK